MAAVVASFVGAGLHSLEGLALDESVGSLCLHHNSLRSTEGIQRLTNLRELNLSCNLITSVGALDRLVRLSSLNLAANLLRGIGNLATAQSLEQLQLQHNEIQSLEGFASQCWLGSKVSSLDLRGNSFFPKEQLQCLRSLRPLKHLSVEIAASSSGQIDIQETISTLLPQASLKDWTLLLSNRWPPPAKGALQKLSLQVETLNGHPLPQKSAEGRLPPWQARQMLPLEWLKNPKRAREKLPKPQVLLRIANPLMPPVDASAATWPRLSVGQGPAHRLVFNDSGVQTDPDLQARLEDRNAQLRQRLGLLSREVQYQAGEAERAHGLLDLARREANLKLAGVRLQAGAALKVARVETAKAESNCLKSCQEAEHLREKLHKKQLAEESLKLEAEARIADVHESTASQLAELQGALLSSTLDKETLGRQLQDLAASAKAECAKWEAGQAAMSAQHANDEEGLRMELARTREHLRTAAASSDSLQQRLEGSEKQVRELQQADCRASEHICELKAARDDLKAELKRQGEAAVKLSREHETARAEWLLREAWHTRQLQEAHENCEDQQRQAVAAAEKLQSTVEECEAEMQALQRERLQSARECSRLQKAMTAAAGIIKAKEQAIADMTDLAQRQKGRLALLQAERADIAAQLAATHPIQVSRLQAEVGQLRESLEALAGCKERALEFQKRYQHLEAELKESRHISEAAVLESTAAVSAAEKRSTEIEKACTERIRSQEEAHTAERSRLTQQASNSQLAVERLDEELCDAKDAIRVKAVMVDSANDSVTSLKTSLRAAEAERADCRKRVSKLQHALMNREEDEAHRLEAMQLQLEQKDEQLLSAEAAAEDVKKRATEADDRCRTLQETVKEKANVLKYVTEEVDRLKALFAEKESHLTLERDAAIENAAAGKRECSRLQEQALSLERRLEDLTPELESERRRAAEASSRAEKHKAEAGAAAARLAQVRSAAEAQNSEKEKKDAQGEKLSVQVEGNTRQLLVNLERQKSTSSATIRRLASVVQELQGMELGPHKV